MIVVSVDKNPDEKVISKGVELSNKYDTNVEFVHVEKYEYNNGNNGLVMSKEEFDKDQVKEKIESMIGKDFEYNIRKISCEENLVDEFVDYISQNKEILDMIVVGHRNLSEKEEYHYGSFSKDLVSKVDETVLIVPR